MRLAQLGRLRLDWTPRPEGQPRRFLYVNRRGRRSYAAAAADRLTGAFESTARTFDSFLYTDLGRLRARCRQAARNENMARRFLASLRDNVIGPAGIRLQARPRDPDGTIDELAAEALEEAWRDWGKPRNCDIRHRLDWTTQQKLVLRHLARDGEALIEEVVGAQAGPYGYALNHLDPELLDVNLNLVRPNGNRVVMGVEVDRYDRPVAYYLTDADEGLPSSLVAGGYYTRSRHRRVDARRIIHLYLAEDAAQHRGVPWMASALYRMQQFGAGVDAATVAFRIGALAVAFVTNPEGEAPTGDDATKDGTSIEDLEPGSVEYLAEGEQLNSFDPAYPNNELESFSRVIKQDLAAGLEHSYPGLASDYANISFSAGRLARIEDVDTWQGVQAWLSLALNQRVYESWTLYAITAGKVTVPGRAGEGPQPLSIDRLEKYQRTAWQGRGHESVDEVKHYTAAGLSIALGLKPPSYWIRKAGDDPTETYKQFAEDKAALEEVGIALPAPPNIILEARPGAEGKED